MPNPSLAGSFKEGGTIIPGSGGGLTPIPRPRDLGGKGFITLGFAGSGADFGPDTPGTSTNGAFEAFYFQAQLNLPVLVLSGTYIGPSNAPAAIVGVSLPPGSIVSQAGAVIYPSGSGGSGVTSLNSLLGALSLLAGSGISVTPSGSDITIAATGGAGVTSLNSLVGVLSLLAGSGISVTPSGSGITIAATGGGSGTITSPASQYIYYNGTSIAVYNAVTQTATMYTTADLAMAAAISNLSGRTGSIFVSATGNPWTFGSQHVLPSGVSLIAEDGAVFTTKTGFTGTTYGQFTLVPIFVLGSNSTFSGVTGVAGTVAFALVCVPNGATGVSIQNCSVQNQIQIATSSAIGSPDGIEIRGCTFTGSGNIGFSSSVAPCDMGQITIADCTWDQITDSAIALIGTNITGVFGYELTVSNCQFYLGSTYTLADAVVTTQQSTGAVPETLVYPLIEGCTFNSENVSGQVTFLNINEGNIRILNNDFVSFSSSTTTNPIFISGTSGGVGGVFIRGNSFRGRTLGPGSPGGGYCVYLAASASGLNEVFIEDNQFNVCSTNHVYLIAYSGQDASDGHTIRISRNYSNRAATDAFRIEPNGGQFSDIQVTDNICLDYNWSLSTSPNWAAVAINRNVSGQIFGCQIISNDFSTTDAYGITVPSAFAQWGIFVGGTAANTGDLWIEGNRMRGNITTGQIPATSGPNAMVIENSIFGQTVYIGGAAGTLTTPSSGTSIYNPIGWKGLFWLTGGVITSIRINGTQVATVGPLLFDLSPEDVLSVTWSSSPTFNYISLQ